MNEDSPGLKLRQARKGRGWTQEQLAEKLFVSRQTISNWENDRSRIDLEMLKQIGEVLELDISLFIAGIDTAPLVTVQAPEILQAEISIKNTTVTNQR